MTVEGWDDIRIALAVAQTGTVSGAADKLGVHHATVIRRIDALETRLGARLFQRHSRGYALTEAGQVLKRTADQTDERFAQMAAAISGTSNLIGGELVITSLAELAGMIIPRLSRLLHANPDLRLRYLTDPRLYRLAVGEAHIAIRAGTRPAEPDYVVRQLDVLCPRLYAAQSYLDRYGPVNDLTAHRFVMPGGEAGAAPAVRWLNQRIKPANVAITSNDPAARRTVVRDGLALGVLMPDQARGLVEIMAPPEWESHLWLVTHVDLHRTPRVQAALAALRGAGI